MKKKLSLHVEVVTGIVQVIMALKKGQQTNTHVSFSEVMRIGVTDKSGEARMFICEYVKDGLSSLTQQIMDKVAAGDYSEIWRATNAFLKNFGHSPVDSVPIKIT